MQLVDRFECAIPALLEDPISKVAARIGRGPNSVYRGNDAAPILNRYGKHTQAQLYDASPAQRAAWGVLGIPNPPGRSTHECRSDGVAYPGPVGRTLADWQCGMDWDNDVIPQVMQAFRDLGELPIHPYSSGLEYHHVNLVAAPVIAQYAFLPLDRGSSGVWVFVLSSRLKNCTYFPRRTSTYNELVGAVRKFQHDHHLVEDGICGVHTWVSVKVAERWYLQQKKKGAAK